ncbi:hypothetical protein DUNSADRAFT_5154 [Dunaliella salina]|uniref:Uncharacterized protein n=1 Tax=Dunaliella salina TaxID=3046 RepID=A0ABQ7H7F2_DUNSA|nr:hypothetical protein DUNSADRAFT_5154 [Dunaliella salina]|eukprot:KAF5842782.1 hypothetical protein DUNSADRAFT_5154 [Dunaliella salina]
MGTWPDMSIGPTKSDELDLTGMFVPSLQEREEHLSKQLSIFSDGIGMKDTQVHTYEHLRLLLEKIIQEVTGTNLTVALEGSIHSKTGFRMETATIQQETKDLSL